MTTSDNGINLIKFYEACILTAYRDSVGILTIGVGHTGNDVTEGMTITQEQADAFLHRDLAAAESCINTSGSSYNQDQFDALVSFTYNLGCGNFRKLLPISSILVTANRMLTFNRAGGVSVKGLTKRRTAEASLFMGFAMALATACPICDQQPWEPCLLNGSYAMPPHSKRVEAGAFVAGAQTDGPAVPITDDSILKTGLV